MSYGWYPRRPREAEDESSIAHDVTQPSQGQGKGQGSLKQELYSEPHPVWATGAVKYLTQSYWPPSISKEVRESVRRHRISGVQVRDVPEGHFLHGTGQQALFATTKFWQFDVLGEYVGKIVGDDVNGHYVAALEDKTHTESLGIDAEHMGNEIRFINSYLNIAFYPNVTMRTSYISTLPHIVLVCTRDIEAGEEFLLDYGDAYNKAYLCPKDLVAETPRVSMSMLPGCTDSSEEDDNWECAVVE